MYTRKLKHYSHLCYNILTCVKLYQPISKHYPIIVFGGTFAALMVTCPADQLKLCFTGMIDCFKGHHVDYATAAQQIVDFAQKARREGVVSLETDAEEYDQEDQE